MAFLKTFLAALGGTATALIILGSFGKFLFEHWFNKALKRYDAELKDKLSKEKARFDWLHVKRAEAIAAVYGKLAEADNALINLPIRLRLLKKYKGSEDEGKTKVIKTLRRTAKPIEQFSVLVWSNGILFKADTELKLLSVAVHLDRVLRQHFNEAKLLLESEEPDMLNESTKQAISEARKKLKETRSVLDTDFKNLLGV